MDDAVSPLIGFVLLLAILMGFIGVVFSPCRCLSE